MCGTPLFCIPKPVPITRYIWYNKLYDINREGGSVCVNIRK